MFSIAEIPDVDGSSRGVRVDVGKVIVVFHRFTGPQDVVVVRHSSHVVKIRRIGVNISVHQHVKNLKIWWIRPSNI